MIDEACEAVDVLGKHYRPSQNLRLQAELQDLKEYFRRPRLLASRDALRGSGVQLDYVFDEATLLSSIFPTGRTRLEGAGGIRFDLVFTLQVSASPFNQGVMVLSWTYGPARYNFPRSDYTASQLNLPHARLDLSTTTMVQLRVPWLYFLEWFDVERTTNNPEHAYGYATIRELMTVQVPTGAPVPQFNLFVHMENLELTAPTVPASRRSTIVPQMAPIKASNAMAEEFENDAYPWSSTLHAASRTARFLASGVPSLASIAGPTSWFLGKAAGVLRYLGYSKPQIQEPVSRVVTSICVAQQNVDVPSQTLVAGPLASNTLRVEPTFAGTDVDEMALGYVLSQWSAICKGNLATTTARSSCIYAAAVSPSAFWWRTPTGAPYSNIQAPYAATDTSCAFIPSHLFFWGSLFRQWRGSFEFRITFCKTKFHAGRVLASFIPKREDRSYPTSETLPNVVGVEVDGVGLQPFTYGKTFDLRDSNVFTFDVPFVCDVPYMPFHGSIGYFTVSVLDPLIAPATVMPSVDFVVEVRGKPDFELAVPMGPLYPTIDFPRADGDGAYSIRAQAGEIKSTIPANVSETCVGERIMSAKQLIMLPRWMYYSLVGSATWQMSIPRWFYQARQKLTLGKIPTVSIAQFGWGGYLSTCYLYVRGGTDVHTFTGRSDGIVAHVSHYPTNFGINRAARLAANAVRTVVPRVYGNNGVVNARIPGYSLVPRVYSFCMDAVDWDSVTNPQPDWSTAGNLFRPPYLANLHLRSESSVTSRVYFMRSAADDAMMGHYIGPPALGLADYSGTGGYDPDSSIY